MNDNTMDDECLWIRRDMMMRISDSGDPAWAWSGDDVVIAVSQGGSAGRTPAALVLSVSPEN